MFFLKQRTVSCDAWGNHLIPVKWIFLPIKNMPEVACI